MDAKEISVNPFELSLDEMIQINKRRNRQLSEETSLQSIIELNRERNRQQQLEAEAAMTEVGSQIGSTNGHNEEDLSRSSTPQFRDNSPPRTRSVHERLGPYPSRSALARFRGKTFIQNQALRVIRNAQHFKRRVPIKGVNSNGFNNNTMGPPLTTSVLRNHNMMNGNFTILRRRNAAPSVSSVSTVNSHRPVFRHSVKKCLNETKQQYLQSLRDGQPVIITGQNGQRLVVDHSSLQEFIPRVDSTPLPTNVRFALYN